MVKFSRAIKHGPKSMFIFSLCLFSLIYGVYSGRSGAFPYPQLRDASAGARALWQIFKEESKKKEHKTNLSEGPILTIKKHAEMEDESLILVTGGPKCLTAYNPNGGCLAWLMNRQGEILHTWKFRPELWANLERVSTLSGVSQIFPVCVHLLEDGGIIVSFQGQNTYPFAVGIARVDKDSNLIWKKECYAHHWFTVTPDQKIITPTLKVIDAPQSIGTTRGRILGEKGELFEDMLTIMTLDGEILEEISMLESVNDSGLIGLYQGAYSTNDDVDTNDPLHLNAVQLIGDRVAAAHEWLNPDDLLVSFRSINTLAIIDRNTHQIKWRVTGLTLRQHSPIFADENNIYVFDNHGGDKSLGGSRLAMIDMHTRQLHAIFPTQANQYAGSFFSDVAGRLELDPSGNKMLITLSTNPTIIELDLGKKTILWECQFHEKKEIYDAKFCPKVSFEMNQRERAK